MKKTIKLLALSIGVTFIGITTSCLNAKADHFNGNSTGAKGAKIYCFMRNSGNTHEVSWQASYAVIKRQNNSLFKTSPKHAAVLITESVVQNPEKYENCGNYLGDLFGGEELIKEEALVESEAETKSAIDNRYNY
tara:strand:- start:774 stop:1178 length:405 start_codon:yes stop_codon:yes gene_type:complete